MNKPELKNAPEVMMDKPSSPSECADAPEGECEATSPDVREPRLGTAEAELLAHGVYMTNTIGHSMEPFLSHHRDAVVIARPEREPRRYDVVLYPGKGESYILHRIVAVRDDHFIIRGDNNYFNERVPKDRIIGILVSFTRKGKRGSVEDLGYRFYSRVRCLNYPLRRLLRWVRIMLSRVKRALRRIIK